eukprot:m.86206 g.86206  ORF g.86206 m.86206 type:complete len:56 (-) comp13047_c0_seq9:228-395(-)
MYCISQEHGGFLMSVFYNITCFNQVPPHYLPGSHRFCQFLVLGKKEVRNNLSTQC